MNVYLFAKENGLEVHVHDDEGGFNFDIIYWDEIAKHIAPHLPQAQSPAPTTGASE